MPRGCKYLGHNYKKQKTKKTNKKPSNPRVHTPFLSYFGGKVLDDTVESRTGHWCINVVLLNPKKELIGKYT